jgi:hypothetical protein
MNAPHDFLKMPLLPVTGQADACVEQTSNHATSSRVFLETRQKKRQGKINKGFSRDVTKPRDKKR